MSIQHTQQSLSVRTPVGNEQIAAAMQRGRVERSVAFWALVAQAVVAARALTATGRRAGRPHLSADAVPY